jgi:hypothetical protein
VDHGWGFRGTGPSRRAHTHPHPLQPSTRFPSTVRYFEDGRKGKGWTRCLWNTALQHGRANEGGGWRGREGGASIWGCRDPARARRQLRLCKAKIPSSSAGTPPRAPSPTPHPCVAQGEDGHVIHEATSCATFLLARWDKNRPVLPTCQWSMALPSSSHRVNGQWPSQWEPPAQPARSGFIRLLLARSL